MSEDIKRYAAEVAKRLPQVRTDVSALNSVRYPGQVEMGTLDQGNRPVVMHPDGGYSTLYSSSFNDGKNEVLVPTVSLDGHMMNLKQAIANYHATGQHLGKFANPEAADVAAVGMHNTGAKVSDPIAAEYNKRIAAGDKTINTQPMLTEDEFKR